MIRKRLTCVALAISLAAALLCPAQAETATGTVSAQQRLSGQTDETGQSYEAYLSAHSSWKAAAGDITLLNRADLKRDIAHTAFQANLEGQKNVAVVREDGWQEWTFDVPEDATYSIYLNYYPLKGNGMDLQLSLSVDGVIPFTEAENITLPRVWADGGPITQDNQGNDIRPSQVEKPQWEQGAIRSDDLYRDEPFQFAFSRGRHTIRIEMQRESIAIQSLVFKNEKATESYEQVSSQYPEGLSAGKTLVIQQAEQTYLKSSPSIYPIYDRSTPSTQPNSAAEVRLNEIGGANWQNEGQWVSWKITVPEDGLYKIGVKYRQNLIRGLDVKRKITIDGILPFEEMSAASFPYSQDWRLQVISDSSGNPYEYYLKKGTHVLRMEVVLGNMAETLRVLNSAVLQLNTLYRRIVMVTGTSPDTYRDYNLEENIPELRQSFQQIDSTLKNEAGRLDRMAGTLGSEASTIYEMTGVIDGFLKDMDKIPKRLDGFKSDISALAQMLSDLRKQPLELDYIAVAGSEEAMPAADSGFFQKLCFRAEILFNSFFRDYSSIGNIYSKATGKPLKVWVSASDITQSGVASGRDQAQIIKTLIDEDFTPKTGISVNLTLVNTSDTLMQAVMGGNGPDAALMVPKTLPINLAMRGALVDLSQMKSFSTVSKRVYPSAFVAYQYNGGTYAVPETQTFNMMFYRKDIFKELGLQPPQTWPEFYEVVSRLEKSNMEVGIPQDNSIFEMMLLQNGGSVYNADESAVTLTTSKAIEAFKSWTNLYVQYSLPLSFDLFNRFRTGEMPLGITSYSFYNQLTIGAPEIQHLWAMAPVPGVLQKDGTIVRRQSCNGTGAMIIQGSSHAQEAFRLIDWWTSDDVQAEFGNEIEVELGVGARYNTANINAFNRLPWSRQELTALKEQWKDVWDIPQTTASYYITRNITNAFRAVVYNNENPREVMNRYSEDMNQELVRRRVEFGLQKGD